MHLNVRRAYIAAFAGLRAPGGALGGKSAPDISRHGLHRDRFQAVQRSSFYLLAGLLEISLPVEGGHRVMFTTAHLLLVPAAEINPMGLKQVGRAPGRAALPHRLGAIRHVAWRE